MMGLIGAGNNPMVGMTVAVAVSIQEASEKGESILNDSRFDSILKEKPQDAALILQFIRELADYEKMLPEVVATEELLREWIFEKQKAEVIFALEAGTEVGLALFFHNFSTFNFCYFVYVIYLK